MRRSIMLKVSLAAGIALLLTATLLGVILAAPAAPQAAVTLRCNPSPPYSISRGMTETIIWEINPFEGTPVRVEFKLYDPDNVIVDSAAYFGNAALSVTRYYTVPTNPKEGFYWARIQYWSEDAGQEAGAEVKFYVAERGNLHVFKFNDVNGNHRQDPGEPGVPDVRIKLLTPFGDQVSRLTDATGWALWDKIAIGTYMITETVAAGWVPVLPPTATVEVRIDATTEITFANQQTGNLRVFKFEDANGNMLQDAGEGPVQGVTITVQSPVGTLWTQTTDLAGLATWNAIPVGTYRVTETLPAGWQAILPPAASAPVLFNATANVTFANRRIANSCIIGRKIDDLHRGLPGWTIHAKPRDAQGPVLTAVTDGHGDFHFGGLLAGWWTVWEEMQPGWAPVTDATFDVPLQPGPSCVEVGFKNRQSCALDPYEPDDTAATAALIAPDGEPQKHTLEPPSDLDWVKFDAVAGGIYTLRTDNLLGSTDTYLTLYDTGGTTLLAFNDDATPGARQSQIVWRAPATGRYFARVRDFYQAGARGCLAYDLILTVRYHIYLPIIVVPPPPAPTPTPTATPTATAPPTPTRTPVPTLPPLVIPGLSHPKGIDVDLRTHHLYVASRDTDVVYQVDPTTHPATVVRPIPVGHEPFGVKESAKHLVPGDFLVVFHAAGGAMAHENAAEHPERRAAARSRRVRSGLSARAAQ